MPFLLLIASFVHSLFKSRNQLTLENLALRQQVVMLRQSVKKPRPSVADKLFWIIFLRYVEGWRKLSSSNPELQHAGIHADRFFSGLLAG